MNSNHSKISGAAILAVCVSAIATVPVRATITANYTAGDLILGIQSSSATAVVVEVNIGPNLQFKNNTSSFLIGNINSQLTSNFTATWYDSPNLFFGVSGVNNNSSLSAGSADANGDFNSTIYASRARAANGSVGLENSTPWSFSAASVTTAASPMLQQAGTFDNNDVGGIATIQTSLANEWSDFNPVSGTAQNPAYAQVFASGIQYRFDTGTFDSGNFGGLTDVEAAIDLYRIARFSNGGGTPGVGTYLGTIALERDGDIRYVGVPEPASAVLIAFGLVAAAGLRHRRRV
jgi:hypothetical protein